MKEHQGKRIGIFRIDHPLRITVGPLGISKANSTPWAFQIPIRYESLSAAGSGRVEMPWKSVTPS